MGPVKRLAVLSALLTLAAPAAAMGADTTVDAAAPGACTAGGTCKTITAAVGVSAAGDTITVKPGGYVEAVTIPADKSDLAINAAAGAALDGGLVVNAPGVKVNRLTVAPTAGGPAIAANAAGFELRDALVVSTNNAALVVSGGAGNLVQRSTLISTGPDAAADGVRLESANAGARALRVRTARR